MPGRRLRVAVDRRRVAGDRLSQTDVWVCGV